MTMGPAPMIMIEAMSVRFGMKLSLARGETHQMADRRMVGGAGQGWAGSVITILSARATICVGGGGGMCGRVFGGGCAASLEPEFPDARQDPDHDRQQCAYHQYHCAPTVGEYQGGLKKMQNSLNGSIKILALLSVFLLGGCAGSSSYMRDVAPEAANYSAQSDRALIVFMRPSGLGFAIQSSVFEIVDGNPVFLGIVSAKAKVAHYMEPGAKRFMVVSESADFMDATLDPGKVYYALVTPRFGVWKARFSLRPIRTADLQTEEFAGWYKDTRWVENLESGSNWANANLPSIREKMAGNLPKWEQKGDRPILAADDGQPAPYQPPG